MENNALERIALMERLTQIAECLYGFGELPATCRTIEAYKLGDRIREMAAEVVR